MLAAFEVNATASVEVFSDDFGLVAESLHSEPFCVLLQTTAFVLPPLRGCN
jgi:hypothetical protein